MIDVRDQDGPDATKLSIRDYVRAKRGMWEGLALHIAFEDIVEWAEARIEALEARLDLTEGKR